MEVKVIEAKNNEIRLVEDILLIYVKDINLLRNMMKIILMKFLKKNLKMKIIEMPLIGLI